MKNVVESAQGFARGVREHPWWRFVEHGGEHRTDWITPTCMVLLGVMGVLFIRSAESFHGGASWRMQIVWLGVGACAYVVVSLVNYRIYLELARWIYGLSLLLLLPLAAEVLLNKLPFLPSVDLPLVESRSGSTRWLDFGVASVQPSELAKVGTLVMLAALLVHAQINGWRAQALTIGKTGIVGGVPLLLIFLQPDLGSSLVLPPMALALLYVAGLPQRFFTVVLCGGALLLALVTMDLWGYFNFMKDNELSFYNDKGAYEEHSLLPLRDYQRNRILAFVAGDEIDPRGTEDTWNLKQSLLAVAGGGLAGKGLGEGTQAALGYLPRTVAPNDFIFSVLAEESGFLGGILVLSLFLILLANGLRIAGLARDRLGLFLAVGVSVIFFIHIFVNIGMTLGLMPITGLPLPFLSYGGSFVLSCCILQGLVQSVYRYRRDFERPAA
ncbi:MAG: FtsW/RodA/SpoVE family cell cycle protein [Opitutales bacterium]